MLNPDSNKPPSGQTIETDKIVASRTFITAFREMLVLCQGLSNIQNLDGSNRLSDKLAALDRISDPELRKRETNWYRVKEKILFFYSLSLHFGLVGVAVYMIRGPFSDTLKIGAAVALWFTIRALKKELFRMI